MAAQERKSLAQEQDVDMELIEQPVKVYENPLKHDKLYNQLVQEVHVIEDFTQLPCVRLHNG